MDREEILGASLQFHCIHGFIDKSELHFVFQFYTMHNVYYSDFFQDVEEKGETRLGHGGRGVTSYEHQA